VQSSAHPTPTGAANARVGCVSYVCGPRRLVGPPAQPHHGRCPPVNWRPWRRRRPIQSPPHAAAAGVRWMILVLSLVLLLVLLLLLMMMMMMMMMMCQVGAWTR